VRQFDLPGPSFHGALHAAAGGVFHYRNLDVSTLKELCRRWQPPLAKGFSKRSAHTALADIHESIEELRYYRTHFLRGPASS
jgi:oligoribonuclease